MNKWKIDPNGICEDHWLDLMYDPEESEDGSLSFWTYAQLRWDGCIHLLKARNMPFNKIFGMPNSKRDPDAYDDYFHICDIDEMIDLLKSLKQTAMEHFKGKEDWSEKG